jgi:hypothetical protein
MEGYKSFREAVESVSSAADSWLDLSTGNWFGIDELRKMGDAYDEAIEPDGWNYFVTFADTGEIGLASTCTREIEFLYVPAGSRYREVIAEQDRRIEEMREALLPVLAQMVRDKIDELGDDPEKYVAVFQRDSKILADGLTDRADSFLKPASFRFTAGEFGDAGADAAKVLHMLKTPGLTERVAAARSQLRNSAEPPEETDPRTVLDRMDYCVQDQ